MEIIYEKTCWNNNMLMFNYLRLSQWLLLTGLRYEHFMQWKKSSIPSNKFRTRSSWAVENYDIFQFVIIPNNTEEK